MGQFFILRSRKFVNWNSPVFLKIYFFILLTYTSNKCFFIISNKIEQAEDKQAEDKAVIHNFFSPVLENASEMDTLF